MIRTGRLPALLLLPAVLAGCSALGARPAWEQPPPKVQEGPVVPAERLHRTTLENGLEVLVLEDHRLPRLALGIVLRRGVASESVEQAGLASYTAELLQRGAGPRDAPAFARAVDDLGAGFDASADWDSISIGVAGLSRDEPALVDLLADAVLRPRFEPGEAARVRSEQQAGLEQAKDEPETLLSRAFARTLYPGQRYGLPSDGTPESVARFDAAAARAFHATYFVPSNAILYAVGDVSNEEFLEAARAAFGGWRGGAPPAAPPLAPTPTPEARRVVIVDRPDLGQSQIVVGHEGMRRSEPARHAALLLADVLGGGGFSSRLMERVRSEAGLTYSIGAGFAMRREGGPFSVATFTRVPETRRVIDLILAELERAKTEPPTPAELGEAKTRAAGGFVLGLETSQAIASALIALDVEGLPPDSLDVYRSRIVQITPEQVAAAAEARLHPERAAIVVVGPASVLVPELEGLGEIEVVKP
ncbi:MAG TPA: pitrilysin family protein [Myxococcota bacterium]|nr:pitrilysin family protein [Myxococcota bacterium]